MTDQDHILAKFPGAAELDQNELVDQRIMRRIVRIVEASTNRSGVAMTPLAQEATLESERHRFDRALDKALALGLVRIEHIGPQERPHVFPRDRRRRATFQRPTTPIPTTRRL